jgi:hypothetical protein
VARLGAEGRRGAELRQLQPAVAVRGPHHGDVDPDVVEPDDTVHPASLDWHLALQLHAKFGKERSSSLKVVDNDADVVHPLNRHIREHSHAGNPQLDSSERHTEVVFDGPLQTLGYCRSSAASGLFQPQLARSALNLSPVPVPGRQTREGIVMPLFIAAHGADGRDHRVAGDRPW